MKRITIFEKKELKLVNEEDNIAYATPTNGTTATRNNIGDAAQEALNGNKTATKMVVPTGKFDGDPTDNNVTLKVDAQKNGASVQQAINDLDKNPETKKLGDYDVEVNFTNNSRSLRENAVRFSKKELNSFLKNI